MKNLLRFSLINTLAMLLLITSRFPLKDKSVDWILVGALLLIVGTWVHYFRERKN